MHTLNLERHNRRAFLRRASQLALAGSATPLALSLAAMGEAAAFDATDYKALVCVFLFGGNDYANTVVPLDDMRYTTYSHLRGAGAGAGLVIPRARLTSTELRPTTALADGTLAGTASTGLRLLDPKNGTQRLLDATPCESMALSRDGIRLAVATRYSTRNEKAKNSVRIYRLHE